MDEPDNHTIVMIGSLADNDPWHLELWVRDDGNAKSSPARWYRTGDGVDSDEPRPGVEWRTLQRRAEERRDKLTAVGSARHDRRRHRDRMTTITGPAPADMAGWHGPDRRSRP